MYSPIKIIRTISLIGACALAVTTARAVSPPPDGGYPNRNTAEGADALFSLTNGANNTAIGNTALYSNTTGNNNTANGYQALKLNTTGSNNTANGNGALTFNATGSQNTANGNAALTSNATGSNNTAIGEAALYLNTTGEYNTADSAYALENNTTGNYDIGLGAFSGFNLTTGDQNIDIGNVGVAGESGAIRIGTAGNQTATFIAGIRETPLAHGVAVAVGITVDGQLGVRASSARFKEAIKPMDKASEAIFSLQPVTFRYKKQLDPKATPQFGLVAEDVAKVDPDLVARDAAGKPFTVRYDEVNAMLLNEFLKAHRKAEQQDTTISELQSVVAKQQEQITALASQIKTVSNRLELSNGAPQVVASEP